MSDKQCAPQGQLSAAAHDLKPPATPKDGGLLVFAPAIHSSGGAYLGEALCAVSNGDRWRVAREALRHVHRGLFVEESGTP